jgi:transposase
MMGEREPQTALWNYRVNLDKRVRSDHALRRIHEVLDLSFVRNEVAHTYGQRGNKSVPPETILRMMLLLFLDDIKSERELMRIIPERLDYLWFLGYGLDDEIPDHSVLSKARRRWGKEVFVSLFSRVVRQCVEAGLVAGTKIHVDASLVDANASLNSVKALEPEIISAIERTAREQLQKLDEPDQEDQPPTESGQGGAPGESEVGKFYKANRQFRSTTDPEATLVRQGGLRSRPRYKTHRVVDDAGEIITALETTTGAVDEGHRLLDLIRSHEEVTGTGVGTVIADARYGTTSNLIGCQKRGITPHLAVLVDTQQGAGNRDQIYPESRFLYQPQSNTYLCPAGKVMRPRRCHPRRLTWEYLTKRGTCLACQLRAFCTRSKTGRTIHRHRDQELLDAAKEQASCAAALTDRKRRQHLMERSFADAANCHGFKRARWRRLWNQTIQDLLIATVQNLRKLVKYLDQPEPELVDRFAHLLQRLSALLLAPLATLLPT